MIFLMLNLHITCWKKISKIRTTKIEIEIKQNKLETQKKYVQKTFH